MGFRLTGLFGGQFAIDKIQQLVANLGAAFHRPAQIFCGEREDAR
jgi:hypothetical protein